MLRMFVDPENVCYCGRNKRKLVEAALPESQSGIDFLSVTCCKLKNKARQWLASLDRETLLGTVREASKKPRTDKK